MSKRIDLCLGRIALFCVLIVVPPESLWAQSFVPKYAPAKSQQFAHFNQNLQKAHVLETLATALSNGVTLPNPVVITIAECGAANAFYNPQYRVIALCYELIMQMITGMQRDFARIASPQDIQGAISGGIAFILVHELGHALIQQLNLPVLGREEDAADQIGAFLMLHSTGNNASDAIAGALWFFRPQTIFYTRKHFSDEHSVGPQRQSNLACWAFGKDPSRYQYLLTRGYLTKERAVRCPAEYNRLDDSVRRLLGDAVRVPTN